MTTKPTKAELLDLLGTGAYLSMGWTKAEAQAVVLRALVLRLPDDEPATCCLGADPSCPGGLPQCGPRDEPAPEATCGTCGGRRTIIGPSPTQMRAGGSWNNCERPCPDCSPKNQPIDAGAGSAGDGQTASASAGSTTTAQASSLLDRCAEAFAREIGWDRGNLDGWFPLAARRRIAQAVLREALRFRVPADAYTPNCDSECHRDALELIAELREAMGVDRG